MSTMMADQLPVSSSSGQGAVGGKGQTPGVRRNRECVLRPSCAMSSVLRDFLFIVFFQVRDSVRLGCWLCFTVRETEALKSLIFSPIPHPETIQLELKPNLIHIKNNESPFQRTVKLETAPALWVRLY